jgi:predicted DNA-binding transcriptional regulator AlpA
MTAAAKQQSNDQLDRAIARLIAISRGEAPIEPPPPPEDRLLLIGEVRKIVPLGKTKLKALIVAGDFPAPKMLVSHGRALAWSRNAVLEWVANLPEVDAATRQARRPLCVQRRLAAASRPAGVTAAAAPKARAAADSRASPR